MATAGDCIRGLRQQREWTLEDIRDHAKGMGLPLLGDKTMQWFALVETGKVKARAELREEFASLFKMTLAQFDAGWQHKNKPFQTAEDPGIPVINLTPAGDPINYLEHGVSSRQGYTYITRDDETKNAELFAVKVVGDSMTPRICEGDLVILWPVPEEYPMEALEGKVVYVHFKESDTNQLARLHWLDEEDPELGRRLELLKDNPKSKKRRVYFSELDQLALMVQFRGRA